MDASSPLSGGEKDWSIFAPYLVDNFEYKIHTNEDGGIPNLRRARKLFVGIHEEGNTLEFKKKKGSDPTLLEIPLRDIIAANRVTIKTRNMMGKRDNLVVQVDISSDTQSEKISIRVEMDKKHISTLLEQISQFKDVKVNPSIERSIALAKDPKLCIQCAKKKYEVGLSRNYNLCLECFSYDYGRIIFQALNAEYYGGHKIYLSGGVSGDLQYGRLILTEHYVIFARGDKKPSKRWEIIIPLDSVIVERWGIEEVSREGFSSGAGDIGVGSGMIYGSGRAHHILVPYIDENGIPQAPRFGLSSYKGEGIRKLASELYLQVVNEKREQTKFSSIADNNIKQHSNKRPISAPDVDEPLKVLKIRFAKGEITKEQYEEMRKTLEL